MVIKNDLDPPPRSQIFCAGVEPPAGVEPLEMDMPFLQHQVEVRG